MKATCRVMLLTALLPLGFNACRSAGPARPQAATPPPNLLKAFVGQTMLLRHQGDAKAINVKRGDLASLSGECDVVVDVSSGAFEAGTARLTLQVLGRPRMVARGSRQERCAHDQPQTLLTVSGFDAGASASDLETALGQVLQTPEAYLKTHGLTFDLPAGTTPPTPVPDHTVTAKPERLIWADADRQDTTGRVRYEGEVEVEGVVGLDGRLYDAKVITALSAEQESSVRSVLPVWRFRPGRRANDAAAVKVREHLVFRIYH